eukprot:gene421-533_t
MSDPFEENVEVIEEFIEGDLLDLGTGNDENEKVEYVDEDGISIPTTNNTNNNNNSNSYDNANSSSSFSPNGDFTTKKTEVAPAMKEFLAKHEKELKDKQAASEEKLKKKMEEAKKSLDAFYSERESKKKTAVKNNREHNKALESEGAALSASTDHSWANVVSMIDLQAKPTTASSSSTTTKESSSSSSSNSKEQTPTPAKDTTRMREILLRLKNTSN